MGSSSSIHETASDIDLHQDLFPDYYGGPTPIRSVPPKEEYLRNDIPNGNNLNDIPNGVNDATPMIKENDFPAPPVPPCAAGEGLPYAPIDWPNPGDIWSWRVGKRVNSAGFHSDRFLNVPKCLRFPGSPKQFASKLALERFLLSHFPNADMNAFFASFSWKVPAVLESPTPITSVPKEDFPKNDTSAVLESPTPITSVSKEDFPRNDIPNGNNLNDIPNGSNDSPPTIKENDFPTPLVSPCTAGEGLPYAPIDWPNPGDIWSWRVGKRVNNAGVYSDRFLNVPKCLRFPGSPKQFASKPKLERFLLSLFPDADMNAFFASFSWNVPAVLESPTPITSVPKEDFPKNDIPNGNNLNDIPNGINDAAPTIKENDFPAPPVPPCTTGEGLPYAPIDWPNPGDIWSWRVGKRVNNAGFYSDRFLNVPKCLRFPGSQRMFASKLTLERFLLSHFPDADMNTFFASFSWNIPAVLESPIKAPAVGIEDAKNESNMEDAKNKSNKKTPRGSQRKRTPPRTPVSESSHKKQKMTKGPASATPKRQTRQRVTNSAPPPPPPETEDTNGSLELAFLDDETTKAEFDSYLNALDELLVQPLSEEPISHPVLYNYFAAENEMAEARMKLSSFLDVDFPSLICFKDLDELTSLASKLRKDPSLSAEQLVKLKLIEEIPSFCDVFLENREVMELADKFFTTLEVNKTKVTSLRQEYRELREQVTHIQSEVDSNTSTVQEIDNQIAQLKSRRAQLTRLIENRKKDKEELTHNQKLVVNSIPKVVHEVQLANAKKPEWELKKENAERREAEILSKFAPLKGFSL
ncbi:hypothetical protein HRI_003858600 [Hibiscus trionum]|nr:hypothetical protein HRI_003858600 [Hibiscus trionum]